MNNCLNCANYKEVKKEEPKVNDITFKFENKKQMFLFTSFINKIFDCYESGILPDLYVKIMYKNRRAFTPEEFSYLRGLKEGIEMTSDTILGLLQ